MYSPFQILFSQFCGPAINIISKKRETFSGGNIYISDLHFSNSHTQWGPVIENYHKNRLSYTSLLLLRNIFVQYGHFQTSTE